MNCYSLILVVVIIVTSADSYNSLVNNENCAKIGCDLCTSTSLICKSAKLKTFPEVRSNIYRTLDIAYQFFTDPTLHKMLFRNFQMLTELKVTFSNINRIASFTFQNLPNLNNLYLNNNRLGKVSEYAFYDLLLEHLYLDDNPYLNLESRAFVGLRVKGLSLTRCNLLTVQFETFEPLFAKLIMLTLTENLIEKFDMRFEEPFSHFTKLSMLSLGKNPLICDCDNLWLIRLLRYRYVNQAQNPLLPRFEDVYPSCTDYKNVSMLYVTESHLSCYVSKIQNISLKLMSSCRAQISCDFSKTVDSIRWYVGKEQVTNQTYFQTLKFSDKSFTLFVDNISNLNGSVKCQVNGKHTAGEIFVSNSKCTKDYNADDVNTVTISKFWLYIWIVMAFAVIISGVICSAYVISLCQEPQPILQIRETNAEQPLPEPILEPANHLALTLPPPLPMLTLPRDGDTNYQTVFYDYPCHREFY